MAQSSMEYGAAYGPSKRRESVHLAQISTKHQSQYQAYRPVNDENTLFNDSVQQARGHASLISNDDLYTPPGGDCPPLVSPMSSRAPSWVAQAIHLQQSLPPQSLSPVKIPTPEPSPGLRAAIFGTRDEPREPYQESVAWANSTQFSPATHQNPHVDDFGPGSKQDRGPSAQTLQQHADTWVRKDSRQYFRHPRRILEPWRTGVWARFPVCGFGALVLIVLLTSASVGIILMGNGMTMDEWMIGQDIVQPQVWISIFEMVMNFTTLVALANGMVIRYWRQMLNGTTLSAMHDTYESAHLWSATKRVATFRFNKVAVACVLSALSFIRGPLFQRSITLSVSTPNQPSTYQIQPVPLAIGASISLISVLAIIPLYMGFWELGRPVTLNPLEIAKAFGAPLVKGIDGNATPERMLIERGGMSIKYGVLERYGEGKDLRVEETTRATIRMPWEGEVFS